MMMMIKLVILKHSKLKKRNHDGSSNCDHVDKDDSN